MEHTEKGDEGRSERGCLGVLDKVWGSEGVWVFRLSQTVHFAPFFFFWISAWLGHFGRYRPIRPIRTELARFGLRQRWFQPRRPDSGIATWHDAARTCGLRRPSRVPASRRVGRGCAGLGVASAHPSLQVINKFYTKAQILFINCCLTIAYAGVTLFRSKIHLLLQACFPNFMVGSEGGLRPIPNLDRDHINHSEKLRIFDIIKRNGTS